MTPELIALALAGLLQVAQLMILSIPANMELSSRWTAGTRDTPPPNELSTFTARLKRAFENHFEGLILFTLAVVVVTQGGQSTAVTQTAAWGYLVARILYIPAYAFGWRPWRSAIWGIGFFATVTMIVASLI